MSRNRSKGPEVHLNDRVQGLPTSPTLAINDLSNQLQRDGKLVFRLGLGQSPFPVPSEVVDALKEHAAEKDYLSVHGLEALRVAVSDYHRRLHHIDCRSSDVLIGPGSKELLFLLQLVYDGELVIPKPSWVSYAPQAQIVGKPVHWLETHISNNRMLNSDGLQKWLVNQPERPRIVLLNYPSNPTGQSYSVDELKEFAELARQHRLIILADEIYGELHHLGNHVSLACYYPEGTIVSSGLSKWCGAGGWRLGTFTFPENLSWLLKAMVHVASETFTSTSSPIQHAAVTAFAGGNAIDQYVSDSRRILRALGNYAAKKFRKSGLQTADPTGGFYLFPDFELLREPLRQRDISTSDQLCQKLLEETGVATLPGTSFGCTSDELTLRIAYVDFDGTDALQAAREAPDTADLPLEFLEQHCTQTVEAIERMCDWVS
ncbi:MAG: aspartate transaminase AspB [Rhodothermia bacterium]|nr:MAG: aspartate transaminase AspB [Rhodothermia bacterium]